MLKLKFTVKTSWAMHRLNVSTQNICWDIFKLQMHLKKKPVGKKEQEKNDKWKYYFAFDFWRKKCFWAIEKGFPCQKTSLSKDTYANSYTVCYFYVPICPCWNFTINLIGPKLRLFCKHKHSKNQESGLTLIYRCDHGWLKMQRHH